MKQKHAFYELAKTRLVNRLTRIAGAYRLGNITMHTALEQSEKAFRKTMKEVNRYTIEFRGKHDLGDAFKPLSGSSLRQLEQEIKRKQSDFKSILMDIKS